MLLAQSFAITKNRIVSSFNCQKNKFPRGFIALCVLLVALSSQAAPHRFENEIIAFEQSDKTNPPPQHAILFVGSSTIRRWKTLARDFPDHTVINRGFGGSMYSDCNYYFDRIVTPYHPKMIVLYAGSNDLFAGKKTDQVLSDCEEFLGKVKKALPDAKVAVVSINASPSRWRDIDKVRQFNKQVSDYAASHTNVLYIDTFSAMLDKDGRPRPELYVSDRLHPNAKGYAIWKSVIAPYLDRL